MHKTMEDEFYISLGANIARCRKRAGLSQATVAGHLGLTRASISNLEAGRQRPLLHQMVNLADILETTLLELVPEMGDEPVDRDQRRLDALRRRVVSAVRDTA
jgi:transcriptional regulator with XRE-family HTH domain